MTVQVFYFCCCYCCCSFFFLFSFFFCGRKGCYLNETIKDVLIGNKKMDLFKMLFFTFLMNMRIKFYWMELPNLKVIKSWKTVTNVKTVTNMKIISVKCKKEEYKNNIKVKSYVKSCYKYENFKYPNLKLVFSAARKKYFWQTGHPKQVLKSSIRKKIKN